LGPQLGLSLSVLLGRLSSAIRSAADAGGGEDRQDKTGGDESKA